jgi:hypothetical protein
MKRASLSHSIRSKRERLQVPYHARELSRQRKLARSHSRLSGIATTFARGRPIDFGLFQIASPTDLATGQNVARTLKNVHGWLGEAILVIAFFHALATLWHHYIRKDDVLTRMLPGRQISN